MSGVVQHYREMRYADKVAFDSDMEQMLAFCRSPECRHAQLLRFLCPGAPAHHGFQCR